MLGLVIVRETKQCTLAPVRTDKLEADRQSIFRQSTWDTDARDAGKICRHRVDIVQVHGEWNLKTEFRPRRDN